MMIAGTVVMHDVHASSVRARQKGAVLYCGLVGVVIL